MASAIVQVSVGPIGDVTFPSTPTEGNLLIAVMQGRSGQDHDEASDPVANDGYVFRAEYPNTDATYRRSMWVFSKVAGAAEATAVTFAWTSGSGAETCVIAEYSGVAGDFLSSDNTGNSGNASGTAFDTGSIAGSGNRFGFCVTGWKSDHASDGTVTWDSFTKDDDYTDSTSASSLQGDDGTFTIEMSIASLDFTGSTAIVEGGDWSSSITTNSGVNAIMLVWDRDAPGGGTNPKGPLGMPLYVPFRGPLG